MFLPRGVNNNEQQRKEVIKMKKVFSKPKIIGKGKSQESMNSCGKAGCQGK